MIAKRYLALLTGMAMATSTIVAPSAGAQDRTAEVTNQVTTRAAIVSDLNMYDTSVNTWDIDAPGRSATVTFHVVDRDGNPRSTTGWTVTAEHNVLTVIPPESAREGDTVHLTVRDKGTGATVTTATLRVTTDGSETGGFSLSGGIEPGGTAVGPAELPEGAEFTIEVFGADGSPKPADGWTAARGSEFADDDIAVTAPQSVRQGDYVVVTATLDGRYLGEARYTVQSDGELPLSFDIGGDVLPGVPSTWDVDVDNAELIFNVRDADGETKPHDNWQVTLVDGTFTVLAPATAREGDRLILAAYNDNREVVGKANLKVAVDGTLMELTGDILAGQTTSWPSDIDSERVTTELTVTDDQDRDKSTAGYIVEFRDGELHITVPDTATKGDRLLLTVREGERVVGTANLRVIAPAGSDNGGGTEQLAYEITGDVLPGIESEWDDIDLPDHQPEFTVVDRDGEAVSTADWSVTFADGVLRVTAPNTAREGDVVTITSRNTDGEVRGTARLSVAVDGTTPRTDEGSAIMDGSSDLLAGSSAEGSSVVEGSADAPWWAVLVPILGIAGVIALLSGGSSLPGSAELAGSALPGTESAEGAEDTDGADADAPGTPADGTAGDADADTGADTGADADARGDVRDDAQDRTREVGEQPATGPVGGQDVKAVAQAQAANAGTAANARNAGYTPAPQQAAAEETTQAAEQRSLADTGVQGTLVALVAGLLAAAAGVFLLIARRRS